MSSDCSLSSPLGTPVPEPDLQLPVLRRSPRQRLFAPKPTTVKKSNAYIFTARLFTRPALDTSPVLVLYSCTQPNSLYTVLSLLDRVLCPVNGRLS
jgi:hypothetical protein